MTRLLSWLAAVAPLLWGCHAVNPFEAGCTAEDAARLLGEWVAESEAACLSASCDECEAESCPALADIDAEYQARLDAWVECDHGR